MNAGDVERLRERLSLLLAAGEKPRIALEVVAGERRAYV